jgi:hypothetical protein
VPAGLPQVQVGPARIPDDGHPARVHDVERVGHDSGPELARVLINLASEPRTLRIARIDRFELAARGLPIHRGDYQVVDLPPDIDTDTIEIAAGAVQ